MNDACLSVVFTLTSEVTISEREFFGRLEHAQGLQAKEQEIIGWFEQYVKSLSVGRGDNFGKYCIFLYNYKCPGLK